MVDQTGCRIVIAHGRENLHGALRILEAAGFPGVLAIADADFSRLEDGPLPAANLLMTDLHDLECMMIASPALAKLLGEFAETSRVNGFEQRAGLEVDIDKLLKTVKNHSQRHDLDDSAIRSRLGALRDAAHDPWQVSCGHDIVEMLSYALRKTFAARKAADVNRQSLERSLRLAYEPLYFVATKMFESIRQWEEANPSYRVLPSPLR